MRFPYLRILLIGLWLATPAFAWGTAWGDICADSSTVLLTRSCTYRGSYRNGEPFDNLTISPGGSGETLASNGMALEVWIRDCEGNPIADLPAERILLTSEELCLCAGGNHADAATDANGRTTFTGAILGDGNTNSLHVVADGVDLGEVPIWVNSASRWDLPAGCFAGFSDYIFHALNRGIDANAYERARGRLTDYNEDGVVDLVDMVTLTRLFLRKCAPASATTAIPVAPLSRAQAATYDGIPSIGIYFDERGTTRCGWVDGEQVLEFWLLARADVDGLSGAEFSISGLPRGALLTFDSGVEYVGGGSDDYFVTWRECHAPSAGLFPLAQGWIWGPDAGTDIEISVAAADRPGNPHFNCPLITDCRIATSCTRDVHEPRRCVIGTGAFINPTDPNACTTSVQRTTWSVVKKRYR